jgi:hypothetical protein
MKFFLTGVLVIIISLVAVTTVLFLTDLLSDKGFRAALLGMLVALCFVASGFISFTMALKYRQKEFNKIVGISILGRLLLMTLVLVSIFKFSDLDQIPFLVGMFSSYFLFQIWELISFNKLTLERA